MQTEIYDERELDSTTLKPECDVEALALIQELGLKQQVSESGARIAHPTPTDDQAFIISTLFPTCTELVNYNAGSIPLRVLKEIRSYRAEHPEHILVVRHSPPTAVKDPILLAYTGQYNWRASQITSEHRLVARWGDALESWDALLAKAAALFTAQAVTHVDGMIAKLTMMRELMTAKKLTVRQMPSLVDVPSSVQGFPF